MANEQQPDLSVEQQDDTELVKQLRAEIRARNDALREAESRATTSEKKATFQTLGINPNKGVGKLFFEAYQGELTEDAVKAAAQEYELPIGQQQQQQEQTTEETQEAKQEQQQQTEAEKAAHATINQASAGAPAGDSTPDPTKQAWEAHDTTFQQTGSREAAMAAHFGAKLKGALEQQQKRG